ncbi:hypothetical protein RAM80_12900 [Pseudomonas sp. App30]|uniref:hypothetical protein n=1 Tax=Pseudomonas sp. App30 TaxID=3068990 RepID=UPI003A8086A6
MKGICLTALVILLAGCAMHDERTNDPRDPSANAMDLKGDAISSALVGRPHRGINRDGQPYSETFQADGTAVLSMGGTGPQKGSWQVTESTLCVNYAAYGNKCNNVKADDQWIWLIDTTNMTTNNRISRH